MTDIELDGEGYLWGIGPGTIVRWDPDKGTYQQFGTRQGLPGNTPEDIFVGPRGVVWLSFSGHGLWRFEDPGWVPFVEQGVVEGTRLDAFAVSRNGTLWICTDEGLSRYDGEQWQAYQVAGGLAEDFCEYLTVDRMGNPWMQGEHGISVLYEPGDWVRYDSMEADEQISFRNPIGAFTAPDGTLWFAYGGGHMLWFDGETWQTARIMPSAFALSSTGQPWVIRDGGLSDPDDIITYVYGSHWELDPGGNAGPAYVMGYYWPLPFHDNRLTEELGTIYPGVNGEMWFTSRDGLVRVRGENISLIPIESIDNASDIRDVEVAGTGEVYVALADGIWRVSGTQSAPLRVKEGLSSNSISLLAVGTDETLWIANSDGLQTFDGEEWVTQAPPVRWISDLLVSPNGEVWLAHGDDGVSRWNGSSWEEFEPGSAPGFFDGRVDSICLSPAGNVCLGIQGGGVSCFDGSQWTGIGFGSQVVGERVHGIAVDGMGEVYVIASDSDLEDAFLYRFDGAAWMGWDIRGWNSLLAVGPDGTVWLAEAGAGLFNIRSGEWSTDDLAEGLPIEEVSDIVFGPDGSMWLGTDNGAWRYDGTDWRSFLRRDVLLSDYVLEIAVSADNTIWFGGIGLARYGAP